MCAAVIRSGTGRNVYRRGLLEEAARGCEAGARPDGYGFEVSARGGRRTTFFIRRTRHQSRQSGPGHGSLGGNGDQAGGHAQLAVAAVRRPISCYSPTARVSSAAEVAEQLRRIDAVARQPGDGPYSSGLSPDRRDRRPHELFGSESSAGAELAGIPLMFSRPTRPQTRDRGLFADRTTHSGGLVPGRSSCEGACIRRGSSLRDREPDVGNKTRGGQQGSTRGRQAAQLRNNVRPGRAGSGEPNRLFDRTSRRTAA